MLIGRSARRSVRGRGVVWAQPPAGLYDASLAGSSSNRAGVPINSPTARAETFGPRVVLHMHVPLDGDVRTARNNKELKEVE